MARTSKKSKSTKAKNKKNLRLLDPDLAPEGEEEGLPKDEAGRRRIKRQYEELLGIRIEKLKGRILNRERINKTIEGIYFICFECKKICHNLDEGLVEDPHNQRNLCAACAKAKSKGKQVAA
ncbi:MAG: hypothetical protein N3C12_02680 [Candidatus Binatia bacterium]|nr:hypothetical protein [Candidatus Binatia bacterium]